MRKRDRSRTESHHRRSCTKSTKRSSEPSTDNILLKTFLEAMKEKYTHNPFSYAGAQNVLPIFDPKSKNQSAEDWIRKVNETAAIYNWQEKQIIYHALPKLSGLAKRWYEGLKSVDLTWKQWQERILLTFPDDRNYGDKLAEMLERKSRREESLEEYYYDKMTLINTCGIEGKDAVDCLTHGIYDHNVKLNAQGANFKEPIEVLKFLRSISKNVNNNQHKKTFISNRQHEPQRTERTKNESTENKFKNFKCFNCSEAGHVAMRCTKPLAKCQKCLKFGHSQEHCGKLISRISNSDYGKKTKKD